MLRNQTLQAVSPVSSFLLKDGSTTSTYMEGQYVCKLCGSSEVVFQQSVSDATCQNCGEWQNEARSAGDSHE
jgi:ribosomal protein S27E